MFLGNSFISIWTEMALVIPLLGVALIVGFIVIFRLRKKIKDPPGDQIAFTLGELKQMHKDGAISLEEYKRAKQLIIDSTMKSTTDSHGASLK